MVRVSQDKEDILQDGNIKLLEEHARRLWIRVFGHVVHQLDAHAKAGILHLPIVVLTGPHTGVDDKLKLAAVELEQRWKAEEIDGLQKLEKLHSVLWILREIFVDHLKCTFEHIFHDRWNLVGHETLFIISADRQLREEHL